jgi:two-component system response regulator RegA
MNKLQRLLIVDDDDPFRQSLARAMVRRGFETVCAPSIAEGLAKAQETPLEFAVVDLRLGDGNGLELVKLLRSILPDLRIVLLTGYGNISSAVMAIKAGAVDYLPKPVEPDRLKTVLLGETVKTEAVSSELMTPERVRWEHIQRVYVETGNNVSETARLLKMHRRSLQRILNKHAPD